MSLKGSKLPKLSRLVYVVEVILFYMLEINTKEGLWSDCHAPVPLKGLEGGQWMVT